MNGDLLNVIDSTVTKAVCEAVAQFKRQNLLGETGQTPFQKTEILLYNYRNFQSAIQSKQDQIRELETYGLRKKSADMTSFTGGAGFVEVKSELEKVEECIEQLKHSIAVTQAFLQITDDALNKLQNEPYFDIIRMKYFEGRKIEDIAEELRVDVSTVCRNKNKLINRLQVELFSDQVIMRLLIS